MASGRALAQAGPAAVIGRAGSGATHQARRVAMLHYAVVFFIIAIIAAVFGFTGIAAGAAEIAKILFYIFLVVFVVTLLLGVFRT
jgi:uncharacterized membrane protein YtjA (UPF0391 family)